MAVPIRALLIDMDGVLYQGEQALDGARETLAWLRSRGLPFLFVTNTTSRPRRVLVEKLARFGIQADAEQIWTPPAAVVGWLGGRDEGPIALYVPPATAEDFAELPLAEPCARGPVAAVVVGDYGERWNFATLNGAFRQLMQPSPPALIALGMTRYWQAEDGLRLDTGPFVAALEYAVGRRAEVFGKPAPAFFAAALARLGVGAEKVCMIGDDIRGDIGGAQGSGIRGLLVKTGKYRSDDLDGNVQPAGVIDSIADLPAWLDAQD
ncbi:HAD-superfamily subfamily IIA hydrolase, TIGR01458 [Thioflavicoccus mobilis 8321]|uniref:Haloacid dehalogenase-like hydrolase domain-containing protein 2 n=1 Tax=Thioflavicoccus mobilis 8321 TaxID=765912 RepID=L0GWF0_9GAMM|nr:TIGR01458 family HAD-type hydrolase [Thioflavicoccus mobilis]AGA91078.1 HAD-superfamily subfamily IIA hydrolase, TIGR01458 [Thioflavicoccus mobilis 8321]